MHKKINTVALKALFEFSTPEISDALDACGINGYLNNIKPIGNVKKLIGPAYTVQYRPISHPPHQFMQASNYIDEVPQGAVIVIDNNANPSCSVWGEILTHYAHNKKIAGTVVHGLVRDVHLLEKHNYPLFAAGITAKTGKNRVRITSQRSSLSIEDVTIHFNDIVIGDSNGVLIIPKDQVEKILAMTQHIVINEKKIIEAINSGKTLKEARETHHYDRPWEGES
jgi:regulator of RNase E activity RraA